LKCAFTVSCNILLAIVLKENYSSIKLIEMFRKYLFILYFTSLCLCLWFRNKSEISAVGWHKIPKLYNVYSHYRSKLVSNKSDYGQWNLILILYE